MASAMEVISVCQIQYGTFIKSKEQRKNPPTAALAVRGLSKGEDKYFFFLWYYLKYARKEKAYTFF